MTVEELARKMRSRIMGGDRMKRRKLLSLLAASPLGFLVPTALRAEAHRIPKRGDVLLLTDVKAPHVGWCQFTHWRNNPIAYGCAPLNEPSDDDLAGGFWIEYTWTDRGRDRFHMQWVAPDRGPFR